MLTKEKGKETEKKTRRQKLIHKDQLVEIILYVIGAGITSVPLGNSFGIFGILFVWAVLTILCIALVIVINLIRRRLRRKREESS